MLIYLHNEHLRLTVDTLGAQMMELFGPAAGNTSGRAILPTGMTVHRSYSHVSGGFSKTATGSGMRNTP